jgi:hypothetical protein
VKEQAGALPKSSFLSSVSDSAYSYLSHSLSVRISVTAALWALVFAVPEHMFLHLQPVPSAYSRSAADTALSLLKLESKLLLSCYPVWRRVRILHRSPYVS